MLNHQIDLQAGESIRLGEYKVTLLEIDDDGGAVLEIEGPEGDIYRQKLIYESSSEGLRAVAA